MTDESLQNPVAIFAIIRGDTQFRTRPEYPGAMIEIGRSHETPLVMAFLWPGIGKQQEHTSDGSVLDDIQENSSVIGKNANVVEGIPFDRGKQGGYSVDEGFTTDDADLGVCPCLGSKVFAAAKSNFQPNLADLAVETCGWVQEASGRERNSQLRQQTSQK